MLIAVLAVLLSLSMPLTASSANVLTINRTIIPEYGGLVYVVDNIHGAEGSFRFGIVEEMHDRLVELTVNGGEVVSIGKSPSGLYVYEVTPRTGDLIITAVYRELITDMGGNNYDLVINAEPLIVGQTVHANILIKLTSYVRYPSAPLGWTLTSRGLEKNNTAVPGDKPTEPVRIRLISSGLALVDVESLDMTYKPSESSILISMRIKNLANTPLRQLDLSFPKGIEVKEVRDTLGKLVYSWSSEKNTLTLNLEQSRYALQYSWRYSFTILARCKTSEIMYMNDEEAKVLIFTPINASISSLSISVQLPIGYEVNLANANLAEYRHDAAGAAIATLETKGLNLYQRTSYVALPLIKSSSPMSYASWLIGGGFVVIILTAVVVQILRGRVSRAKIVSEKDLQLITRASQELQKMRALLLELESSLAPTAVKIKPQVMTDKMHVVRRMADGVIDALGKMEEKPAELQEIQREINLTLRVLNETLRVILRNYSDFQKGELSLQSYKKIYDSFRKDFRNAYDKLIGIEEALRDLSKK